MKKWIKRIFLLLALGIFLGATSFIKAQSCESTCSSGDSECLSKRIADCQSKVDSYHGQANTLSNQIAQFDYQIKLAVLKITQTEEQIVMLGGRIDQLETSLGSLTNAFSERAVETYKMSRSNEPAFLLLNAKNLDDVISSFHYLAKIQEADRNLMLRLQKAQNTYKGQKVEQEDLAKKLADQKRLLDTQKAAKATLLKETKNNEAKYQSLLTQALAEKAAIERALVSGVQVGPIKRGDPIALMGNSGYPGCSTGKHLHFEIRKNGTWTDPSAYLSSKTVVNDQDGTGNTSIGSGGWSWPISDTVEVTQFYGHTPYSWQYTYSGGIHTGIDMISTGGDVVRAPADGTLFKSSQACGGSSIINIVYIDHGDGVISLYLHVQ